MKPNKYRAVRTEYNGRVYASKGEAELAQSLDIDPTITVLETQPGPYTLGAPGVTYRPDFLVAERTVRTMEIGRVEVPLSLLYAIDFKGRELPAFKRAVKLWEEFGPLPLKVISKHSSYWVIPRRLVVE